MNYYENVLIEELIGVGRQGSDNSWDLFNNNNITMEMDITKNEFFSNSNSNEWQSNNSYCNVLDSPEEYTTLFPQAYDAAPVACYDDFTFLPFDQSQNYPFTELESLSFPCGVNEDLSSVFETVAQSSHGVELPISGFNVGSFLRPEGKKVKSKKVNGQPSKNLMAERRRRKRLNDRLSMLRSIVPKISKMDRTSILGNTIDYMKELLEKINNLQEEMEFGKNELSLMSIYKDVKPNEMVVRNSPKFDVESRDETDARIEICCGAKPGLLLSTVATLENLGLEIQQCVIGCFNDFSMHASCTNKEMEQLSSEDIRQALFKNAGYGGKCF